MMMSPIVAVLLPLLASGFMKAYDGPSPAAVPSVLDPTCYSKTWPNVTNCVQWWTNSTHRFVEGNGIPDHDEHGRKGVALGPYCPFGEGDPRGYCLPMEGAKCPFKGMICPAQEYAKELHLDGDVVVPIQIYKAFPLHPDPTAGELPNHLYHGAREYQQVGVHMNGVHIKGPGEAEGYNVDTSMIPLLCGGHVTPPIGPGPMYHYHKVATCGHIEVPGQHGPLVGYANDGYGIYGFQDVDGTAPIVDECNGHFGPLNNNMSEVVYHYHIHEGTTLPSMTFKEQEPSFQPYFIGCQGPSKGKCNSTIAKAPANMNDLHHNWCGVGCGYEICVQPGTSNASFAEYLTSFGKSLDWLKGFSVNDYSVCPECYRGMHREKQRSQEKLRDGGRCHVCNSGACSHCRSCTSSDGACAACWRGGCVLGCSSCWADILV